MPLGIALKNASSVVIASDVSNDPTDTSASSFMTLPNRTIIVISGADSTVHHAITQAALPLVTMASSTAAVAQYVHAALVLHVIPVLDQLSERTEVMVAGIDPVRHVHEPNVYYLDSEQNFRLSVTNANSVLVGLAAQTDTGLSSRLPHNTATQELVTLVKECFANAKLRWPTAVAPHLRLAIIDKSRITIEDY